MGIQIKGSTNSTTLVEVDTNYNALRMSRRPLDIGSLGHYRKGLTSGALTGTSANNPVYSFRGPSTGLWILHGITLQCVTTTAFGAAQLMEFAALYARSFSASDSGGTAATLTGNNSKKRTSHATMGAQDIRIASTGTLTAGTRTLDSNPFAQWGFWSGALGNGIVGTAGQILFTPEQDECPGIFAANEGFIITTPTAMGATGVVRLWVDVAWAEVTAY